MIAELEHDPALVPTFTQIGGSKGPWCVRHRRDDPLPIDSKVEVLRANGTKALMTIKGRLALVKGSKAKTHVYVAVKTYMGDQIMEQGPWSFAITIRRLDGTWEGIFAAPVVSLMEGD